MSNNGPNFITGLKCRMNQLASFFTEQLEKELAKPNIAVEDYKTEVQSLEFRVKNLEQTIENLEKTTKAQNTLISQIKDSQTNNAKRATGNPAKPKAKKKPQSAANSPSNNRTAEQQTLTQLAAKSPIGPKRNSVPSPAAESEEPDIKYIKTEPAPAAPNKPKPMTSTSGGNSATSGFKKPTSNCQPPVKKAKSPLIPDKGQPETSTDTAWTWGDKIEAIDEIQRNIALDFSEVAAIMVAASNPKFQSIGENRLKSWWVDREQTRSVLKRNPRLWNNKSFRKPNVFSKRKAATGPADFEDDDGDSVIASIPETDIIEIASQTSSSHFSGAAANGNGNVK